MIPLHTSKCSLSFVSASGQVQVSFEATSNHPAALRNPALSHHNMYTTKYMPDHDLHRTPSDSDVRRTKKCMRVTITPAPKTGYQVSRKKDKALDARHMFPIIDLASFLSHSRRLPLLSVVQILRLFLLLDSVLPNVVD